MGISKELRLGCLLACNAAVAQAQTAVDRSFTSVAGDCDGIQWSERALQLYPTIAAACQSVEERGGKTYVKFQGTVKRVTDGGRQLTVNFKDAGDITLSPPPETSLYMDGRKTPVSELQRGDELNFYIAEDRLAAQFPEEPQAEVETVRYTIVPLVASATERPPASEQLPDTLPSTASPLPMLLVGGGLLLGVAGTLSLYRRR